MGEGEGEEDGRVLWRTEREVREVEQSRSRNCFCGWRALTGRGQAPLQRELKRFREGTWRCGGVGATAARTVGHRQDFNVSTREPARCAERRLRRRHCSTAWKGRGGEERAESGRRVESPGFAAAAQHQQQRGNGWFLEHEFGLEARGGLGLGLGSTRGGSLSCILRRHLDLTGYDAQGRESESHPAMIGSDPLHSFSSSPYQAAASKRVLLVLSSI
ncbi:hypothetical protein N431DRAFT_454208 [Stipitochalara longipes BDJ]|nr:hypothetical protein N431DRAFT_454208 [Stipitochalara longipes BDJ]